LKVIKPLRLSLIHRVFDHRKKHILVTTVAYAFPFSEPRAPVTMTEMWKMASTELGRFGVLDFWMFKPQAEVLVTGACYTGEREKGSEFVRLSMGPESKRLIDKTLYVFGDRRWTLIGPSEPAMFTRMPLDYAHAFGGEKYDRNPIGKGLAPLKDEHGQDVHPLPNVEDPKAFIKSKGDRPPPASFAAWDLTWPVHFEKKMGTYDADWVQKNGFSLADDIDFSLFNVAPPDQRVPDFFRGDEELRVENMHPERRQLEVKLPGYTARCLLKFTEKYDPEPKLREVGLRADTIHLFPHHERAIVFFRGTTEIHTTDATCVDTLLAAIEDPAEPRSVDYYQHVIDKRADKKRGAIHSLRDMDLLPPSVVIPASGAIKVGDPLEDFLGREGYAEDNQWRRVMKEYSENRERLLAHGVEPDKIPPPPERPPQSKGLDFGSLPALFDKVETDKAAAEKDAVERKAEAEALLESLCKEHGVDLEAAKRKAKEDSVGPPRFTAKGELERLTAMVALIESQGASAGELATQLADPNFRAKLLNMELQLREKYRLTAHSQDPAFPLSKEGSESARAALLAELREEARERRDFTGADLSGLDLTGANLEWLFLEKVDLTGANLRGANLKNAVLAHAKLDGADLSDADLTRANLGHARLEGCDLRGAKLDEAILHEATFRGSKLCRARLNKANTFEVDFGGCDFSESEAQNLFFYKVKLAKASFRGSKLNLCAFVECDATGIDAANSDFSQSVFLMSTADDSTFEGSAVENFRIVLSSFQRANFAGARMPGSNLRAAKLAGANLSGVNLRRSDLSQADLTGANLEGALLVECLLMDTILTDAKLSGSNLMLSIMHRAQLAGADVSKANLFCADLTGAAGDKRTSFSGSNVKRALVAGVFHG
jgi:uncharacterized protein YjbI with pentapeptide repeats